MMKKILLVLIAIISTGMVLETSAKKLRWAWERNTNCCCSCHKHEPSCYEKGHHRKKYKKHQNRMQEEERLILEENPFNDINTMEDFQQNFSEEQIDRILQSVDEFEDIDTFQQETIETPKSTENYDLAQEIQNLLNPETPQEEAMPLPEPSPEVAQLQDELKQAELQVTQPKMRQPLSEDNISAHPVIPEATPKPLDEPQAVDTTLAL